MAAFNFPNSPSTNDLHTENSVTWKWDGVMWNRVGPAYTDTTNLNVTGIGTIAGNFHVGGVLTYEDVKNVDSVGIITARSGIDCNGNATFGANGTITTGSNFSLNGNAFTVTGTSTVVGEFKKAGSPTIQCTDTTNSTDLQLRADATGGLVRTATNKPLLFGTNQTERLRITSDGKIGIGVNNPNATLTISHAANTADGIQVQNTNNSQGSAVAQVLIMGGDNAYGSLKLECNGTNHSIQQDGNGHLKFVNASTERLRIDSTGKIGINNSSPNRTLNITSATGGNCDVELKAANNTGWCQLIFSDTDAAFRGGIGYEHQNNYMAFYTGAQNERLRITSNGSVNIGTGNLNQTDRMLNVYGGRIRVEGITTNSNTAEFYGNTTSGQSYGLLVSSGTTSGDQCAQFRGAGGTNYLKIRGDGYLECGSTVALKVPSGTTAQRPTGVNGMLRYNTTNDTLEGYVNSAWSTISQDNLASNGSYANNTEAIADDLYAYWNCNSTGLTRTGGDSGAVTLYSVSSSSGKIGNYWNRGTATTHGMKFTSMPTSNNLSISFWFIQTDNTIHSTSDGAKILTLHNGDCGSSSAPILGYDGSNGTVLRAGGTGWVSTGTQIATITTNTWYHIGITKSGNDWKYYFNGSLQHSPTESQCLASTWWISNYNRIANNNNTNNHYHRGGIDEFAVWHRTLTSTEVSAIYTASAAGTPLI